MQLKLPTYTIEISLYVGCGVNCSYCPQLSLFKRSEKKTLSVAEYKILLAKIPKFVGIAFIGMSEPLLHKDFKEILEHTIQENYKVVCFTTLPDKYPEHVSLFLDSSLWLVRSLHIRDDQMSYKNNSDFYYKNVEAYFSQINTTIKKDRISILTKNVDPIIERLLTKYNLNSHVYRTEPFVRIKAPMKYRATPNKPIKGNICCSEKHDKIQHLLPDGDVVLCCMDVEKNHVLGNLFKDSYESLFRSAEYNKILEGFTNDKIKTICRTCAFAKKA